MRMLVSPFAVSETSSSIASHEMCSVSTNVFLLHHKQRTIQTAIRSRKIWYLRELALTPGGLLNDELRRQAWPLLMGSSRRQETGDDERCVPVPAKDLELISYDVARCQRQHATAVGDCSYDFDAKRLRHTIVSSLNGGARYFQGYHEIAATVVSVFQEENKSAMILKGISEKLLSDYMAHDSLVALQTITKMCVVPLLAYIDPRLHDYLVNGNEDGTTFETVCLSWILTLFSNDTRLGDSKRVLDACLASHALFPVYAAVALLLHNRCLIARQCECDSLYETLSSLPHLHLNVESVLAIALDVMNRVPPSSCTRLARSYYGRSEVEAILRSSHPIQMLQGPISITRRGGGWVKHCFRFYVRVNYRLCNIAGGWSIGDAKRKKRRRTLLRLLVFMATFGVVVRALKSRESQAITKALESYPVQTIDANPSHLIDKKTTHHETSQNDICVEPHRNFSISFDQKQIYRTNASRQLATPSALSNTFTMSPRASPLSSKFPSHFSLVDLKSTSMGDVQSTHDSCKSTFTNTHQSIQAKLVTPDVKHSYTVL